MHPPAPHTPLARQMPLRQTAAVPQGRPSGSPHCPSLWHTSLAHCAARSHGSPLGRAGRHVSLSQKSPAGQSPSAVQAVPHWPPTQVALRHAAGVPQASPSGKPHSASLKHTALWH